MLDQQGTPPQAVPAGSVDPSADRPDDSLDQTGLGPDMPDAEARGDAAVARPRISPSRQRLISLLEVAICSGLPTQLLVTLALASLGIFALTSSGHLSLRYIVWLSLIDTSIMVVLVVVFLRARAERPSDVFLGGRRVIRESAIGLLLLPVSFLLVVVLSQLIRLAVPWLRDPAGNPLAELLKDPRDAVLFAAVAILAGGLREELQRAFILHRFEQHLGGAVLGLVLFSAAFGLGHSLQGWDAAVLTGSLGFLWGTTYLWRRSIVAPAVCHALFNLTEVLFHGLQA